MFCDFIQVYVFTINHHHNLTVQSNGTLELYPSDILFSYRYTRNCLTLLLSERPKLYTILAFMSAIGLNDDKFTPEGRPISRNVRPRTLVQQQRKANTNEHSGH